MAPFCIEPLDKGVEEGRRSCQKAHFQGAPAPPTSDSRLAARGEREHRSAGWVPVMLLPSLPQGLGTGRGSVPRPTPQHTPGPAHCPPSSQGGRLCLAGLINLESTKPPTCSGLEFTMLVNLKGKNYSFIFTNLCLRFSSFFNRE